MKKLFTLISIFLLGLNYSKGQVRLTEVQPLSGASVPEYFELFYKTSSQSSDDNLSLNGYVVVVYHKRSGFTGIRVAQFANITPFGTEAVYNNPVDPEINPGLGTTNGTVLFSKTSYTAYTVGNGSNATPIPYPNQESWSTAFQSGSMLQYQVNVSGTAYLTPTSVSDIFDDQIGNNNSFGMLLFKAGKLIDFVSNSNAATEINKLPSLSYAGQNIDFSNVIISGEKVGPSLGNNSTYEVVDNSTNPCAFDWNKETSSTPLFFKAANQLNTPTWENDIYFWKSASSKTSNPFTSNDYTKLASLTGAVSYNGSYGPSSIDFFYQLINPTNFNTETPASELSIQIWVDVNNNGTTNSKTFESGIDRYVTGFSISDNKFLTNLTTSNIWIDNDPTAVVQDVQIPVFNLSIPRSEIEIFDQNGLPTKNFSRFYIVIKNVNSCLNYIQPIELATALPVSLKNLKVVGHEKTNNLEWRTEQELNNKGFEIQRSIGNTNDFKTIGFVGTRAKDGNSQTEISYSFEDADVKAGQTHYYRLNQIDFDGKATLSPVRSVKPGSIESNLNVYPNPSQGSVTVNTGSASGKLNIYVIDNTGRVVNQYINVSTSNTRINNLKKGFYTLKLVNTETGEQSAQRVVVQ